MNFRNTNQKFKVVLSVGDESGIGREIILQALYSNNLPKNINFVGIDLLKNKITDFINIGSNDVIINLASIDSKERQRFTDILTGATFSIKGAFKNIGDLTYVCAPVNHLIKNSKKYIEDDSQDYLNKSLSS